jgi:hypothetical protein
MRLTTRVLFLLGVVATLLAGCSASSSSTPSATPNSSAAAVEICPEIDLRMPNGDPLDLSGRWLANTTGSYFLSQDNSCLFWMGESSPWEDVPAGAYWTNVFSGRIVSSFVAAGPWSDVPAVAGAAANHGQLRLAIEFFDIDGVTWPSLSMLSQEPADVFGDTAWQREESISEIEAFTGTFGIDESDCPWLEVDGQRYALVGSGYIEGQHVFSRDGRGVLAGAQAHVEAQVAAALSDPRCPSSAQLLVWDLYPAP